MGNNLISNFDCFQLIFANNVMCYCNSFQIDIVLSIDSYQHIPQSFIYSIKINITYFLPNTSHYNIMNISYKEKLNKVEEN